MLESSTPFSSWSSDTFIKDSLPAVDHTYSCDSSVDEFSETYRRGEKPTDCSQVPTHSGSGSNTGGADSANMDEDIQNFLPVSDAIELEDFVHSIGFADLNWEELEAYSDQADSSNTTENNGSLHVSKKHGKRKKSNQLSSMQWSNMSPQNQLETLEALSQIISQKMTLREQMEVITVIDPSAMISPNDTEFTIDLKDLNDSKLEIIRDIVNKYTITSSSSSSNTSGLPPTSAVTHKCSSKSHHNSKVEKSSKKQTYEKRRYLKEIELRQRKILKQKQKENRSGLFLRERKIKFLHCDPCDENEYVNILD